MMNIKELLERRLLFFTGKGGVGKSTVVAGMALEAAKAGKRALIVEFVVAGKDIKQAIKSGSGAVIGLLSGTVVKFVLALVMVLVFVSAIFFLF